ncbi:MAG TPA: Si-specific NAD(P)(+) transhydrogenase [Isosphaeraceae bacterium]|jgi:NAD(P) transhydrogenase
METETYDLIVIGSGPAGEKGAAQVAYFGKKVALVEKEPIPVLGGAATNTGTLPSKTLRETALFLSGFRNRELDGLDVRRRDVVTVRDLMAREQVVRGNERARILKNLQRHGVAVHTGTASFVDPHTIAVRQADGTEGRLRGEVVLIATGSYPFRPPGYNFGDPRIYDSDEILDLQCIPETMLVVGGGVIGCEYACMFAALGIRVTLLEKRDRIVGFLDTEISEALSRRMQAMGITLLLGDSVESVDDRRPAIAVNLKSGSVLDVASILVSSGRCGNTAALGLDRVGIAVDGRGYIPVDEHYRTAVPHVYAAGDVVGFPALASTSMEQARVAMVHAFQLTYKKEMARILPYGIYTIPECSMVGATEEELIAQKIPYVAGRASYAQNARGQIIGDHEGFLKLLFREDDLLLLGVHVIGELATEIVHVGLTALLLHGDADLFIQACYNYPTLTEVYKYATYDALGQKARRQAARLAALSP